MCYDLTNDENRLSIDQVVLEMYAEFFFYIYLIVFLFDVSGSGRGENILNALKFNSRY